MTAESRGSGGAVWWLAAQALAFGAWAALLGTVANAMFLEAYGSEALPVTYIVIGLAGIVVSAAIRRGAERFELARLAVGVLAAAAAVFAGSWLLATTANATWVSGPLLVLFPILIQLGFVFIGGQAGRVLDIGGIKASFPRIMAGFPIGAVLGGVAAVPLVDWFGRVEDLLVVTAIAEASFAALVWATGRRYARLLEAPPAAPAPPSPQSPQGAAEVAVEAGPRELSLRALLARPLVALVLAYQVLTALASQLADFLVFNRASALFPGAEDLGRFVAGYTAVMNGVAIGFLVLLAGPLLRRFGLRLGIAANPVVGAAFAVGILAVLVAAGPLSIALLAVVSAARVADIALTDGMTRTSINAVYQVLPTRQRLAAQATVEGMGVPIAIGLSGVLILVLNALPDPLGARIVLFGLVCAAWAWAARRVYRAYGPALVEALRSGRLLDPDVALDASASDLAAVRRLVANADPAVARLGRELAAELEADPRAGELAGLSLRTVAAGTQPAGSPMGGTGAEDAGAAALASALEAAARPGGDDATARARQRLRAVRTPDPAAVAVLARHLDHPDRSLGLAILERLATADPAEGPVGEALDALRREDLEHARLVLQALVTLDADPGLDADGTVRRALGDELDLDARRVAAGAIARRGRDEVGAALRRLATSQDGAAIAAEALEVALGHAEAARIVALLDPTTTHRQRLERLGRLVGGEARPVGASGRASLLDLATDRDARWRSPWLRACAVRALRLAGLAADDLRGGAAAAHPVVAEELALTLGAGTA